MTDKTLGAYERHEKHDAADFATARFATRSDGRLAARLVTGTHPGLYPWHCSDIPGRSDRAMAEDGFTPVRECPNPDQHTEANAALAQMAKDFRVVQAQRDDAGKRASKAERELRESAEALDTTMGRALKAERERDEALRGAQEVVDRHNETLREIASGKYAAVSRPLTPDAITDQLVDYVHEDYFWSTSDRVRLEKPALKHALLDAVKRLTEARPEWQRVESLLREMPPGTVTQGSKWLVGRGVRVVTEEQP